MRFQFDPKIEAFRAEVRQFISEELPPEEERPDGTHTASALEYKRFAMDFYRKLADRGWLVLAWPREFGGAGASYMEQLAFTEEMAYVNAPLGSENMGVAWVGPALMLYGTKAQQDTFLPGITQARDWWCTLYSEPEAGSDLASLQTRAVRDGDEYVINGQKIWTTRAHISDWGWLAARTDPNAPKHKGISMFLVDMKSPGITVRPLPNMAGQHEFNEVFFDNVRVPAANLVGEENRGWYYLAVALDFERSSIGVAASGKSELDKLSSFLRDHPEILRNAPGGKRLLADRYIEVAVSTLLCYHIAYLQDQGQMPNKEASVAKVFGSELRQRIAHTRMKVLGTAGQLLEGSRGALLDAATPYMWNVAATIGGGTSEVNRTVIATRGLGLPRG